MAMHVVVGLGNPGLKYRNTRHNIGFEVLGELAQRLGAPRPKVKFEAEVAELTCAGDKLLLVAPQTFMNLSGRSVRKVVDFYELPLEQLLVVCDDMNLDLGVLRLRAGGAAGGQKGLQDIINRLASKEFPRLRLGIGRAPEFMDPADYVLSRFQRAETEAMTRAVERAVDASLCWLEQGLDAAMNRFNGPAPP
jgi:PTH1 family peptidyl-tRNA hydrolase